MDSRTDSCDIYEWKTPEDDDFFSRKPLLAAYFAKNNALGILL